MAAEESKIKYLEGLRGLAAFVVVIHHFIVGFMPALHYHELNTRHFENTKAELVIANSPLAILYSGNLAVCIFFVLSGYVLTKKYFDTGERKFLVGMMVKRYSRLMIPVGVSSLLIYLVMQIDYVIPWYKYCFTYSPWLCNLWPTDGDWLHFLKTTFIRVPLTGADDYNTVLWTMQYEFLGSIGLGLCCLMIIPKYKWTDWFFLAVIIVLFYFGQFYYIGFLTGALLSKIQNPKNKLIQF